MTQSKVLVTGASGFIALHCIYQLLRQGHSVRGSLRTMSREAEVRAALGDPQERLEFVQTDLLRDDGWAEAATACDYILHIASPLPVTEPKNEDDLILPAREGTLRVLRAAKEAGVKRVVLTSSTAAIVTGATHSGAHIFTEKDWTDIDGPHVGAYPKSKTLAERAAWDFVEQTRALELAVINPGVVLGPLLGPDPSASGSIISMMMMGKIPACPRIGFNMVDVRDVAAAHILAMTHPNAAGERFLCCSDHAWMKDIAQILDEKYGDEGWKISTRELPDFVVKAAAPFSPALKRIRHMVGRIHRTDNTKIRDTLGLELRGPQEMIFSMVESMIELGVIKKS